MYYVRVRARERVFVRARARAYSASGVYETEEREERRNNTIIIIIIYLHNARIRRGTVFNKRIVGGPRASVYHKAF